MVKSMPLVGGMEMTHPHFSEKVCPFLSTVGDMAKCIGPRCMAWAHSHGQPGGGGYCRLVHVDVGKFDPIVRYREKL